MALLDANQRISEIGWCLSRDVPDGCSPCRPGPRPCLLNRHWTRAEHRALSASEMRALATIPESASLVMMSLGVLVLAGLDRVASLRAIRASNSTSFGSGDWH